MFNLAKAKAEIEKLTNQLTEKDQVVATLTAEKGDLENQVSALTTERDEAVSRAEAAEGSEKNVQAQLTAITEQNTKLQSRVDGIDDEVKTKATDLANSHLASLGQPPITDSAGNEGGAAEVVTENSFWKQYREQPASSKAKWYEENKHQIGL